MHAAQCRASTLSLAAVAACLLASQGARAQGLVIAPVTDAPYARLGTEGEIAISGLDEMGAQLRLATPEQAQPVQLARRRWHWSATRAQFTPGAFQVLGTASAGALP